MNNLNFIYIFTVSCKIWDLILSFIIVTTICIDPRLNSKKFQAEAASATDECQVTPVIHVLQYPGCVPKPIPSFACIGRCASYLQVGTLKKKNIFLFFSELLYVKHCKYMQTAN